MSLADWSVYYIYNCRHTDPPKNKFAVIFLFPNNYLGFLINSEIHPFIQRRNYLLPCIAKIKQATNPFLTHDSFTDCREMLGFNSGELVDHRGGVCDTTKQNIIKAVMACPVLELKYKNPLLERYGGLIDY